VVAIAAAIGGCAGPGAGGPGVGRDAGPGVGRDAGPGVGRDAGPGAISRVELTVESAPGIAIAIRAVTAPGAAGRPVLLVHGAGGGGVASFDLPVPGYSLAEDLARAGHPTYVMDVRGWGRSTRPPALAAPPEANPPAVGSDEAVVDIAAAVAAIRARHRGAPVALVGWATGGHWAGMYAAGHPGDVSHLVMLNALYGTPGAWALRAGLEDPARPGELAPLGAYSRRDGHSLVGRWEASIPLADKDAWRDPRVAAAYVGAALASDPEAARTDPPRVRVPTGPLRDSYFLAGGTPTWRADAITARVLVVRGSLDFWSRPEDLVALRRELRRAAAVEIFEIPGATHLVHLDRPERGRRALVARLVAWLAG
jgi:pimeloyl-ACP methyl ester carboxylesterase